MMNFLISSIDKNRVVIHFRDYDIMKLNANENFFWLKINEILTQRKHVLVL